MEGTVVAASSTVSFWQKPAVKWTLITTVALVAIGLVYRFFIKDKTEDAPAAPLIKDAQPPVAKATIIPEKTAEAIAPDKLPNGGIGCSAIRLNNDFDFNYVKCKGIWYAKFKESPRGSYDAKHKADFADWKSLEGNDVAIDRLNIKYPND